MKPVSSFTLNRVHDYQPVPGHPEQLRLVATNHYARITVGGQPPLYIQNGRFWSEGGDELTPVPAWAWKEAAKLSKDMQREIRLRFPGEAPTLEPITEPVAIVVDKTKACPMCKELVSLRTYGFHIARHRAAFKKQEQLLKI